MSSATTAVAEWRRRHPNHAKTSLRDRPEVRELNLDPAEVERKRLAALEAKAELPQDSGEADGSSADRAPVVPTAQLEEAGSFPAPRLSPELPSEGR